MLSLRVQLIDDMRNIYRLQAFSFTIRSNQFDQMDIIYSLIDSY